MNRHIIACGIASLALFSCGQHNRSTYRGNEADMKGYFEGASTPELELKATKELNERFKGYEVHSFDRSGNEVKPYTNGDYDAVHRVKIQFRDSDIVASRIILNRRSLTYIYGE
jgi:hypothetical protein